MQTTTHINWNDIWKTQMHKHIKITHCACDKMWDTLEGADQYVSQSQQCNWDVSLLANHPVFQDNMPCSVLDIGAGPGTHTIPLAQQGCTVTAIEPAMGMLYQLRQQLQRNQIGTVKVIPKRWEDITVGKDISMKYDIALASFSLGMIDIQESLQKMQQCAKTLVILWHVGVPTWEEFYINIWEKLHGSPYYPVPKSECLLHIIRSMGIQPHVILDSFSCFYRFSSLDHAQRYFISELQISTDVQKNILQTMLKKTLAKTKNGWCMNGTTHYAIFSWDSPFF